VAVVIDEVSAEVVPTVPVLADERAPQRPKPLDPVQVIAAWRREARRQERLWTD
jgi:hypothetical protein